MEEPTKLLRLVKAEAITIMLSSIAATALE
jgi:hypothetical protein